MLTVREIFTDHFCPSRDIAESTRDKMGYQIRRFEKHIGPMPAVEIGAETFHQFRQVCMFLGLSKVTIEMTIDSVLNVLRCAESQGIVPKAPEKGEPLDRIEKQDGEFNAELENFRAREDLPITVQDLERILGAARTMPEALDGIPGGLWWPALVLCILDTGRNGIDLLELPVEAYDRDSGALRIGRKKFRLHAHTANALDAVRTYDRERLFPWPKDGRERPYCMFYHDYQDLLHRAGLPPMQKRPLARLRKLGERYPQILDAIDSHRPFQPIQGKPDRGRKRKPKRRKPRAATAFM